MLAALRKYPKHLDIPSGEEVYYTYQSVTLPRPYVNSIVTNTVHLYVADLVYNSIYM